MTDFPLPEASFWDETSALEKHLGRAFSFPGTCPFLGVSTPGLLMWGHRYSYVVARKGDASFLLSVTKGELYAPRPPQPFTPANLTLLFTYLARVNGKGAGLSRVEGLSASQAAEAAAWGHPTRTVSTDFVYDRSRLAGLHGDPYRDRRNEINRLQKGREVVLRPWTPGDLPDAARLFEAWREARSGHLDPVGRKMMEHSREAHHRLLEHHAAWGLEAWSLEADGRLAAYSVAGPLETDTLGVYAEVSDLTLPGAAAYIFVNLCRRLSAFSRVNTGDAEFLPGLRESKEHWHPAERRVQYAADPVS